MQVRAILLAAALALVPLSARAADLVVWWEKSFYPEQDQAIAELVAAFEGKTGGNVDLVRIRRDARMEVEAALEARQPPDFLWGLGNTVYNVEKWAHEDRLVDLTRAVGPQKELFDADLLERATLPNAHTGGRGLYALPMGRSTHHLHVWKSLLKQAGFTLADIPKEWEAFWSFWCDTVQPTLRKATRRDDIYGVGLGMSVEGPDGSNGLDQFLWAHTPSDWPPPARWSLVDMPPAVVRAVFVKALESYTAIYKRGCTAPTSVDWDASGNNEAFLAQTVVMTANVTLSITNALRAERPEDYREDAATINWPRNASGGPLVIVGGAHQAVVFKGGKNPVLAEEFVRFLVADGWLAHWLASSSDWFLPPMRQLIDQPFWLDPKDPHRLRSAMQTLTQPQSLGWWGIRFDQEGRAAAADPPIYATAVHRVAAEGWTSEQAVDEAIARIKQLLSE
jgi:multiple sugar transport system substrate-binding protein